MNDFATPGDDRDRLLESQQSSGSDAGHQHGLIETAAAAERLHRTRNVLAVMRSVFARTMESGASIEEVTAHYQGRFDTLAPFLAGSDAGKDVYDLELLIRNELLRYQAGGDDVEISGPAVQIPHAIAQPVALAMHELATNAVKFGALVSPDHGHIEIRWWREGADLVLHWHETGVSIVRALPLRPGIGREFIEHGLPYQIGAETSFQFEPGGVLSTFRLPLDFDEPRTMEGT